jgi:2-amino-4-hydroxy-6-hydroxymethyldihydropteridine diphosphokinase
MNTAYLLLGTNIGNRLAHLKEAVRNLQTFAELVQTSSIYETAAWGKTDQQAFLNQVVEIKTALPAHELMDAILAVERSMGRIREERYGPRTIDIDILFFGDEVHDSSHITIPHPELPNRRFALVPLAELAANLVHPGTGKSVAQMLDATTDKLEVKKWKSSAR